MPEHIAHLNRDEREALLEWLQRPNGAHTVPQKPRGTPHSSTRVSFEAVGGGGIFVRTYDYREDAGALPEPEQERPPHEIVGISKDGGFSRKCRCGETISLNRDPWAEGFDRARTLAATTRLAELHVERGNAHAAKKVKRS